MAKYSKDAIAAFRRAHDAACNAYHVLYSIQDDISEAQMEELDSEYDLYEMTEELDSAQGKLYDILQKVEGKTT